MPRIAIIGAGIAGLNAALTLQDSGLSCDIYEASDRIGGRMHSDVSPGRTVWSASGVVNSSTATMRPYTSLSSVSASRSSTWGRQGRPRTKHHVFLQPLLRRGRTDRGLPGPCSSLAAAGAGDRLPHNPRSLYRDRIQAQPSERI